MTAFLFIPSATGVGPGRRVDFTDIARLFSEGEEPPLRRERGATARIALLALILLGAIGDTVLVARSNTLENCLAVGQPAQHQSIAAGRS